ncbi:hypothetical protein [Algivirga pacifica]|uniref:Uncharacterized protein n=1 Tax=Algivirga pacifica TaxID=1162670 RepID=A0ABP9D125_9BACT
MMEELINYWKLLESSKPYIHPADLKHINRDLIYTFSSIEDYYTNDYWTDKNLIHTDLFPVPYIGDLLNAKVFILMLNPGLSFIDYHAEIETPSSKFIDELKRNLKQENLNKNYPLIYLNPSYAWHSGSNYWLKKFKALILSLQEELNISFIDAIKIISQNIAIIELYPYHSKQFTNNSSVQKLSSVQIIKEFVHNYLVPKAVNNEICIISTRQSRTWNLLEHQNIISFTGSDSRSAHLTKSEVLTLMKKFISNEIK